MACCTSPASGAAVAPAISLAVVMHESEPHLTGARACAARLVKAVGSPPVAAFSAVVLPRKSISFYPSTAAGRHVYLLLPR